MNRICANLIDRNARRTRPVTLLGLLVCLIGVSCEAPTNRPDTSADRRGDEIYQIGTLSSLLEGDFEGPKTAADLMQGDTMQGDTLRLGTIN